MSRSTHCGQQINFCKTFSQLIMIRNHDIMITADFIMIGQPENDPPFLTNPPLEIFCIMITAGFDYDYDPGLN